SSGISCSSSISDLMTARKSGTFGWDLPAMPPSRTPPANGAAPSASAPRPTMQPVCQEFTPRESVSPIRKCPDHGAADDQAGARRASSLGGGQKGPWAEIGTVEAG